MTFFQDDGNLTVVCLVTHWNSGRTHAWACMFCICMSKPYKSWYEIFYSYPCKVECWCSFGPSSTVFLESLSKFYLTLGKLIELFLFTAASGTFQVFLKPSRLPTTCHVNLHHQQPLWTVNHHHLHHCMYIRCFNNQGTCKIWPSTNCNCRSWCWFFI